ncbi:MAG: metalloregulator ArsR/SmtB family transcription factor [Pseudomonadota bacterium]|nr:metalloregulator ArsR/SmtB family transcription factor [Pseudomonadota bacterium]
MNTAQALDALAALAQKNRLAIFRHLVELGPEGACPGDIAAKVGVAAATLSFHLKTLQQAGLIDAEQHGRSITYRANFAAMQGLIGYLGDNCCGGDASLCAPAVQPARIARSTARRAR